MQNTRIILSHSGKQHSYQVAKALCGLGLLEKFHTSSYVKSRLLQQLIIKSDNKYWSRRFVKGVAGPLVDANWRFELPEVLLRLKEGKSDRARNAVYARDQRFDNYVSRQLKKHSSQGLFWGFQGSCLNSLKTARTIGMEAWCELATAHVTAAQRILGEEAKLQPKWAGTIDNLVFPAEYQKRLEEEPHVADKVIAASQFTKATLLEVGIKEENIVLLPLGCDIEHVPYRSRLGANRNNTPLKILYAGTVTQRKGVSYLLDAVVSLKKEIEKGEVEFHFIGGIQSNPEILKPFAKWIHYHPPVSQQELFKLYSRYDALLLPTIFEGFGLVIVEAMAAGLPVITTPHSIGPELIRSGENGFIIPIRDSKAIEDAVLKMRHLSDSEYYNMSISARESAEEYSWKSYQSRLKLLLNKEELI